MDLEANVSGVNCLSQNESDRGQLSSAGVSTALASVLIFTIVVDILGNVLVILSVYRNKKLRNAGERQKKIKEKGRKKDKKCVCVCVIRFCHDQRNIH